MRQQDIIAARSELDAKIARAMARLAALPRVPVPEGACATCGGIGEVLREGRYEPCPACVCPTCGNLGFVRYDVPIGDPRFGKVQPCPANCKTVRDLRARRLDHLRAHAALPKGYRDCTFETYDALPPELRRGKETARAFAELWARQIASGGWVEMQGEVRNWLMLWGPNGVGKTGLAASAMNHLTAADQPCLYIRLQDLVKAVQDRYGEEPAGGWKDGFGSVSAGEVIESAKTAPALIIDEFDVPDLRDNKRAIVEMIVRYRHGHELPTLMTTNLDARAFMVRWEATIGSVVRARAHWVLVEGLALREEVVVWRDGDL